MFRSGILGINARNLSFIKKYNDKTAIWLVDNKLKTKKYFSQMGVPCAKTYKEITSQQELKNFSLAEIRAESFVIKPNRGSKGKGILILERREGAYFSQGKEISQASLMHHMRDILDGAYSLSGFEDTILIEERLIPHHDFQPFCTYGLSDIRVIVFNYVPVAAMLRMPTQSSQGRANMYQDAVGMGIDIGTGKISTLYYQHKIYTSNFPDIYQDLYQKKIPEWEKILLMSSQIQGYVDLGYVAHDWVVSYDGPKLLEINARAGLEIQNVTGIPLKARMDRIKNMKIADAHKGVSLAKSLFSSENHPLIDTSNSLYLSQLGTLHYELEGKHMILPISVKVDTHLTKTRFSQDVYDIFQATKATLTIDGSTISFQNISGEVIPEKHIQAECILATKDIQNYVIRPIHRYQAIEQYFDPGLLSSQVKDIDVRVNEVSKYLNLSYHLEAINFEAELQHFLDLEGRYNPIFEYRFPDSERLSWIHERLKQLQDDIKKCISTPRLQGLYAEKIQELLCKWDLLKAYSEQNFDQIALSQKKLYGEIHQNYLEIAEKKLHEQKNLPQKEHLLGKLLSEEEIIKKIEEKLIFYGLPQTQIVVKTDMSARISVTTGQYARINLKYGVKIYEKELDAVLAHELGVHMRRFINGSKSGLRLLKHGTGFYLEDEEGLAIYHSLRYLPVNYEKNDMYIKYALCEQAHRYSFRDLAERLKDIYGERSLEAQFSGAFRLKKGIVDTSQFGEAGLSYIKDIIYLNGYMKVKKWGEEGGYLENLMVGKIKIQDIETFTDF